MFTSTVVTESGRIVGIAVGGTVGVIVIGLVCFIYIRGKNSRNDYAYHSSNSWIFISTLSCENLPPFLKLMNIHRSYFMIKYPTSNQDEQDEDGLRDITILNTSLYSNVNQGCISFRLTILFVMCSVFEFIF